MKRILITICGRAGSKGFQNKNLKDFCGLPMVYYSLSAAELFCDENPQYRVDVCLNTDSPELEQLVQAKYPNVVCLRRGSELCGDTVPKEAVYQDCLLRMEELLGAEYDCLVDLDITSPLRQAEDLSRAVDLFFSEPGVDLVLSAVPSRRNPYFNMGRLDEHGNFCRVIENKYTARQQAPVCYDINASLYIFARDYILGAGAQDLWQGRLRVYEMADTGVLDIDCEEDHRLMEIIGNYLYESVEGFAAVRRNIHR